MVYTQMFKHCKVQRELSVKCLTHASCHLLNRSYLVMHVIDLGERSLEAIHHFFHLCLSLYRLGKGGGEALFHLSINQTNIGLIMVTTIIYK